jgi:hypothetical protein
MEAALHHGRSNLEATGCVQLEISHQTAKLRTGAQFAFAVCRRGYVAPSACGECQDHSSVLQSRFI